MKIHQIIREKRKELSLTQEQLAEQLGVSAPAVNKWEKGSTYPDITLLPPLARLLKIDLNTLLSFHEDLTETEIEHFVNDLDRILQEQGYPAAFRLAMDKIREYPTCDRLIYTAILYLDGALSLYHVPEPAQYRETFSRFYRRLAENGEPEIRDIAISMLIAYARNRGEYAEAEELIQRLPSSVIDKEEQLAVLYQQQKNYAEAEKRWEHILLDAVTEIQTALVNMLEIALKENRHGDAEVLADRYEEVTRQFALPEWMRYNAHLLIALEHRDRERSLTLLEKMLPAMKEEWVPQKTPLYRTMENAGAAGLSGRLRDSFCEELLSKEEYAFLQNTAEFARLMEQR